MKFEEFIKMISASILRQIISLKVIIIMLVIITVIALLELISNIPIVGNALSGDLIDELQATEGIHLFSAGKLLTYKELEDQSYITSADVIKLISKSSITVDSAEDLKPYSWQKDNPEMTEGIIKVSLGEKTGPYRLWWQSIAAIDMVGLGSDAETMKVVTAVTSELQPVFDYNFTLTSKGLVKEAELYDSEYIMEVITTKTYRDGSLIDESIRQLNTRLQMPYCGFNQVSTMFYDYSFAYVKQETSHNNTTSRSVTHHKKYEKYETGSYGYDIEMNRYVFDPERYLMGERYAQYTVEEITITERQHIYETYATSVNRQKNQRYKTFFTNNKKETGHSYKEDEGLEAVLFGAYMNDSYDFVAEGFSYYDKQPSFHFIESVAFTGLDPGNYAITSDVSQYRMPINFSKSMSDEQRQVRVTSTFGYRESSNPSVYSSGMHNGLDFALPVGTPVVAVSYGEVIKASYGAYSGNEVTIKHLDGSLSRYLHNANNLVSEGAQVSAGDVIALSGNTGRSTGPHLHFEVRDINGNPVDPMKLLPLERISSQ